jgi:hypothetical protein
MPTRVLLTPAQRAPFLRVPDDLDERDIARYYTFSADDLALIRRRRRAHNRLGFAVQLAYTFVRVRSDLANDLKGLNDALQQALDVDDAYFEYDQMKRARPGREPTPPPTQQADGPARGKRRRAFVGVVVRVRPADVSEALNPQPQIRAPTTDWRGDRSPRRAAPLQRAIDAAVAAEDAQDRTRARTTRH